MQRESQWPGDAIAAPFCPACDRGAAFFEGLGRSWNRVDADTTAVVLKDRRDAVIKPAPGWSPPSSQQLLRRVAVNRRISHTEPDSSRQNSMKWFPDPSVPICLVARS